MTPRNHAASARARLLNLAREQGEDFQRVLVRYGIERLLFRLSKSRHADDFVLKGATLFALWLGSPHRATKDLDLLGRGSPDADRLARVFRDVVQVDCPEDGMVFDAARITGAPIREDAVYAGIRLIVPCELSGAKFNLQVDVGMGDSVVPPPEQVSLASLLDLPAPKLRAYAKETVIAEKLEALVILGLTTSRMKDLYDLDFLRRSFDFEHDGLVAAVKATFERRATPIPDELPIGLSDVFAEDSVKLAQWRAFLRKSGVERTLELSAVVTGLRVWLWPVLESACR